MVTSASLDYNDRLIPAEGVLSLDPTPFYQLFEGLVYFTITRQDIGYVVHVVSQFMAASRSSQHAATLHILRYV